nr:autotransporter outer membrane beta-barrel domain-containing protein [Brucella intermedia]
MVNGGEVFGGYGYIGRGSDGVVVVSNVGSKWQNDYMLFIGSSNSNGSLDVTDGGEVISYGTYFGYGTDSSGTVRISGAGSQWRDPVGIVVGVDGSGTLVVSSQGHVTTDAMTVAMTKGIKGQIVVGSEAGFVAAAPGTIKASRIYFGAGDGRLLFNHTARDYVFDETLNGGMDNVAGSGTGLVGDGLIEALAGRTILNIDHGDFTGTLQMRDSGVFQINGNMAEGTASVLTGGRLEGNGVVGSTTNAGVIAPGMSIGTLTIDGNYIGDGGILEIEAVLGDDNSPADRLIVTGDTSGQTYVQVLNRNGLGAQTSEGIRIVEVGGASEGGFSLVSDYRTKDGQQAVIAGAYAYTLHHNGFADPANGNWYLRSRVVDPDAPGGETPDGPGEEVPQGPRYGANVPVAEAYPQVLQALNGVSTLQQRVGNRYWKETPSPEQSVVYADGGTNHTVDGNGVWGRIEGTHSRFRPAVTTSSTGYDVDTYKMQAGLDGLLHEGEGGRLIGGLTAHYVHGKADVTSFFGDGEISTDGYGFGGTLTWYGNNGFYLDAQAQATWYDSNLLSLADAMTRPVLTDGDDGFGYALSLEGGKRIELDNGWLVTPQAQLAWSSVDFDSYTDPFGSRVSLEDGDSLRGRLGLSIERQQSFTASNGKVARTHVYGIANLYGEFLDGSRVNVAGVSFDSRNERIWGGIGLGGSYNWNDDKYSVYGEGSVDTSLQNFADSYTLKGTAGFRVKF